MAKPVTRSAPIRAAWRKGMSAGLRGLDISTNPHLGEGQSVQDVQGWSRMYAAAWAEGHKDGVDKRTGGARPDLDQHHDGG